MRTRADGAAGARVMRSRRNETSDRWRILPRGGRRARMGGRAISWTLKDVRCFLWIESEGRIAHASSTAAPAIVSRSVIAANSALPLLPRPAPSHHHDQTFPRALGSRISSSLCLRSSSVSARVSPSLARRISSFFTSRKLCGMPAGEVFVSISKFQRAAMKTGVVSEKISEVDLHFLGIGSLSMKMSQRVKKNGWRAFTV
jgi:hypothetical protein